MVIIDVSSPLLSSIWRRANLITPIVTIFVFPHLYRKSKLRLLVEPVFMVALHGGAVWLGKWLKALIFFFLVFFSYDLVNLAGKCSVSGKSTSNGARARVCHNEKRVARRMASTTSDTGDTSSKQQQAQCKENYNKSKRPVSSVDHCHPYRRKKRREAVY